MREALKVQHRHAARAVRAHERPYMNDFNQSPHQAAEGAEQFGHAASNNAKEIASDLKQVAGEAAATTRAYAKDAVNAAGKKIQDLKGQAGQSTDYIVKAINEDPVKAVLIAAAVSSVVTAVLLSATRSSRRFF